MCDEHVDVETQALEPDNTPQENRKEEFDGRNVDDNGGRKDLLKDLVDVICEMKDVLADASRKDELIAKLHERVEAFEQKQDWREIKKPLYLDLIALVDALEDQEPIAASYMGWSKNLPRASICRKFIHWTCGNIRCLKGNLLDLLARHGVTQMPDSVGEEFDRARQRAVNRVLTDAEEEDREVSRIVRQGYGAGDEGMVRYQEVWVKSYNGEHAEKEEEQCEE